LSPRRRALRIVLEELSDLSQRPMIIRMTTMARPQQRYDHRLRDLVQRTGDVTIATSLGVPRSTARGWLGAAPTVVVSLEVANLTEPELRQEILRLRRRVEKLAALLRLALALLQTSGFRLSGERLPDGQAQLRILRAVDRARECIPLRAALRFLGLSPSRFHAWRRRQTECTLDDRSSCPRASPHRLRPSEVQAIGDMVTSPEYRHVPTGTLAVLAQRLGRVSASPSTWHRLVRKYGWRRPRLRVHPAKPKVGLRTTRPDDMWHIDTTVIRLCHREEDWKRLTWQRRGSIRRPTPFSFSKTQGCQTTRPSGYRWPDHEGLRPRARKLDATEKRCCGLTSCS
jgi:putative transposase